MTGLGKANDLHVRTTFNPRKEEVANYHKWLSGNFAYSHPFNNKHASAGLHAHGASPTHPQHKQRTVQIFNRLTSELIK